VPRMRRRTRCASCRCLIRVSHYTFVSIPQGLKLPVAARNAATACSYSA
jgi:hypothetical protein